MAGIGMAGSIADGLGHALDGTSLILSTSLNDWARFTRAGAYRLVVTSSRVREGLRRLPDTLTAPPIEFTVTPADDAWAASEVARATALIDRGGTAERQRGAALLDYLGTEPAAKALVDRYDALSELNVNVDAKLMSAPARQTVITEMETRVDAGAFLRAAVPRDAGLDAHAARHAAHGGQRERLVRPEERRPSGVRTALAGGRRKAAGLARTSGRRAHPAPKRR